MVAAAATMKPAEAARGPGSRWGEGAAVAALAGLAFAGTLGHGFVWDDPISIERWLPALPRWWSPFFPPPDVPQFPPDYYRPLQLLSYRLDLAIGGGAPWSFHASLVLLHVLASVLVLLTGRRLLEASPAARPAALFAALLFAVHPIHTESVAWIAARPDVMVVCAGMAALLAYWRASWPSWQRATVAAAAVFTALLCKENAAALLILVPASTWALPAKTTPPPAARRRAAGTRAGAPQVTAAVPPRLGGLTAVAPFVMAALAYVALRSAGVHGGLVGRVVPEEPLAATVAALGTYLRLLAIPHPHDAYIADLPAGAASLALCTAVIAAYAAVGWWAWRRRDRPMVYALAWIGLTLAPSLAVIAKPLVAPLAERYLYLPSVGFCWAFGSLAARFGSGSNGRRRLARIAIGSLILIAFARTGERNAVWRDNLALWSDTAARNPVDGLPTRNLAAATAAAGDTAAAERLFLRALEMRNTAAGVLMIHSNLGSLAFGRGDLDGAESHYRQALAVGGSADALYNLGLLYLRRALDAPPGADDARQRDAREAEALLQQAAALNPHDADTLVGQGYAARALGDPAAARAHFEAALALGLPPEQEREVRRLLAELP